MILHFFLRFVFDLLPVDFKIEADGDREEADKRLKMIIASKNRTIQQSLKEIGIKLDLDFSLSMHVGMKWWQRKRPLMGVFRSYNYKLNVRQYTITTLPLILP